MEALVALRSQEALRREKTGLSLLLAGSLGVQVHSAGSDDKKLLQRRSKVAKLELQLDIPMGKLCAAECCILQCSADADLLGCCLCMLLYGTVEQCHCAGSGSGAAGGRWTPGQEQYDAALHEVACYVCGIEERVIQDHVFKLKLLLIAKAEESSSAGGIKLKRRISKQRR